MYLDNLEFVIISDSKMISSRFTLLLSGLEFIFNPFFYLKNFVKNRIGRCLSQCVDCTFKSTKKLNCDISVFMNKPKTPSYCRFPLANPHTAPVLYFVTKSNPANTLILWCICSANLKSVCPFSQETSNYL